MALRTAVVWFLAYLIGGAIYSFLLGWIAERESPGEEIPDKLFLTTTVWPWMLLLTLFGAWITVGQRTQLKRRQRRRRGGL